MGESVGFLVSLDSGMTHNLTEEEELQEKEVCRCEVLRQRHVAWLSFFTKKMDVSSGRAATTIPFSMIRVVMRKSSDVIISTCT